MAHQGSGRATDYAARVIDKLFNTYLDQPVAGLWCDQYEINEGNNGPFYN